MAKRLTSRFQLSRTASQLQTRSQKIQTQGTRYRVEGTGSSRTPRLRGSRSRRVMRRGTKVNLRRLGRELADLPRFSSFIQRREQRIQAQLRAIPGDILRTVYAGSGIPNLLQPYHQLMAWYQFFSGLDESWFGNRSRETDEDDDEDEDEYEDVKEKEPEVIVIYRDREEPEQERTTQIGDTFGNHQKLLFGHIDKIISLLQGLNEKPYRRDTIQSTRTPFLGNRNRQENEDDAQPMLAALLAGIAGALIGALSSGGPFGSGGPNSMLSGLTRVGQFAVGALSGNALGRLMRDRRNERRSDQRRTERQERRTQNNRNRNARNIRSQIQNGARTRTPQPSRLRGLMRTVRRAGGTIARTVGGMGRGAVQFLRMIRRIVRIGGIAGAIAIPILEWFERNAELRQLAEDYDNATFRNDLIDQPERRERARAEREAQIITEGVVDVIGVTAGAAIGGVLGGGFLSLFTGAAGAWLGQWLADRFNENFSDDIARFIVDPRGTLDSILTYFSRMDLPQMIREAIRTAPLAIQALMFPVIAPLRLALDAVEAVRPRTAALPPEEPEAEPTTPSQQVAEEPPQLERIPEGQRTLTVAEQRIQDTNVEAEPEEHDHAHEISTPTRRSSQAVIVREIHTLIYKSNKLVLAK